MPHRALLMLAVLLMVCCALSSQDEMATCKTVGECQTKLRAWESWADKNMPKCKEAMKDADKFEAENKTLRSSNESLENRKIEENLATAAVGVGVGLFCAFWLARALKRVWPVSSKGKQLVFMVCGAVWITVAALIAVNDSDLSQHPVNMLFTVLVYSLPGLLFGGIGFWWFGKPKQLEPMP